jgi:hypothetical protein
MPYERTASSKPAALPRNAVGVVDDVTNLDGAEETPRFILKE